MFKGKTVSGILLAAGSGNRMEVDVNKVYLPLDAPYHSLTAEKNDFFELKENQVPALYYPLAALEENEYIDEIILVIREEDKRFLNDTLIQKKFPRKPVRITVGGQNRYDSVYKGLLRSKGDIALIHDGARPLLKQQFITDCVEAMDEFPGAVVGIKSVDRLCSVDEKSKLVQLIGLEINAYLVQTPQCFHAKILKECHEKTTDKSNVKDDSTLLELNGYEVKMLPGSKANIKITFPSDMLIAGQHVQNDEELLGLWRKLNAAGNDESRTQDSQL
jgi:2-C-methyl-D-erythritol 4-phosphate cytidylyltransferase